MLQDHHHHSYNNKHTVYGSVVAKTHNTESCGKVLGFMKYGFAGVIITEYARGTYYNITAGYAHNSLLA